MDIMDLMADEVAEMTEIGNHSDMGDTRAAVLTWFDNDVNSPVNFKNNIIVEADGEQFMWWMKYSKGITHDDYETLWVPSASMKSLPYAFQDFIPVDVSGDPEFMVKGWVKDDSPATDICIYGHNEDVDDEFRSRLDSDLVHALGNVDKSRFKNIILFGAFENVESMQQTILGLYDGLSDRSPLSRVKLHLDSKLRDDNGRIRTIADLVSSGYIKPDIVGKPNMVEYVFKKFNKRIPAILFTKTLETSNKLFSEDEMNGDEETVADENSKTWDEMSEDEREAFLKSSGIKVERTDDGKVIF